MAMTGIDVDINDTKDAEKIASEMLDLPDKLSKRRGSRRKSLLTIDGKSSDSESGSSRRGSHSRRRSSIFLNVDGKDSEDENCLNSVIKCTLDETSLLDPIKRCGSQRRRKKSNLDGLVNDNESDDETTMTRSGSRRQSKRRQNREKGRMSRA